LWGRLRLALTVTHLTILGQHPDVYISPVKEPIISRKSPTRQRERSTGQDWAEREYDSLQLYLRGPDAMNELRAASCLTGLHYFKVVWELNVENIGEASVLLPLSKTVRWEAALRLLREGEQGGDHAKIVIVS